MEIFEQFLSIYSEFWNLSCIYIFISLHGGVMVIMLTSIAVNHGFEPWSGQIKDYKISICCFSTNHAVLKKEQRLVGSESVALFTKILTIKNCRKCKTKIKKSFTKILTIILSVKIVLTLRVKLPCPKCKILIVREILVLSFIVSEKNRKNKWTMYWCFDLKIREQFIVSTFSLTVW
jgi:hypothetical protein